MDGIRFSAFFVSNSLFACFAGLLLPLIVLVYSDKKRNYFEKQGP